MKLSYDESNLLAFFKFYASISTATYSKHNYYSVIQSTESSWPNSVFSFSVSDDIASIEIEKLILQMQIGQLPSQLRTPPSISKKVFKLLCEKSLRHITWTAMGMKITNLINVPTEAKIRLVEHPDELTEWLTLVEKELMQGGRLDRSAFEKMLHEQPFKLYLATLDGRPVSTALTFENHSTVGVYLVATYKAFRRRGIGAAITSFALKSVQNNNIKYAYLQATDIGKSTYASIGFENLGRIGGFAML